MLTLQSTWLSFGGNPLVKDDVVAFLAVNLRMATHYITHIKAIFIIIASFLFLKLVFFDRLESRSRISCDIPLLESHIVVRSIDSTKLLVTLRFLIFA